jgi:hypothetical protein
MNRREIIAGLGRAAAWPVVARAQQGDRVQRIGLLMSANESDPVWKPRVSAFTQALADLGWTDGRTMRMDVRWGGGDTNRIRALAQELAGLQPDIIVTNATPATAAVQREMRTISIVFANVSDPVASSIVTRLDRPGGTSPASPPTTSRWEANGLSCSRRLRPGSSGSQSCSIPTLPPHQLICPHLRPQPGHSRSRQSSRPFIAT